VLDGDGSSLRLVQLDRLDDPAEVVRWVEAQAGPDAVVGIDAPIVIPNATGMRTADRLAQALYGKFHAGAYPASRARTFWQRTTRLSSALAKLGFQHGDQMQPKSRGRYQIEVHPHAASVQLFGLDQIVKYKKGTLAARAKALRGFRALLLEHLPRLTPRLEIDTLPSIPSSGGKALKAVEDQLDAVLCAYIAAHWWYWGRDRNDVLGNARTGYIVIPRRRTPEQKLADLRDRYSRAALDETDLDPDPIAQFDRWFAEARASGIDEANAMTLATAAADGQPSARMVLLRDAGPQGFVFFTNYGSQKGRELAGNPKAALVFHWRELHRQVRITGTIAKTSRAESQHYFASRPRGAQLSAWASWQSSPVADREFLEARVRKLAAKYHSAPIPAPPGWGGYRLRPDSIEFWQGRQDRLHDRLRYTRQPAGWRIQRLAP
jgi:pyridoxamine 5'-phosphate oxidase